MINFYTYTGYKQKPLTTNKNKEVSFGNVINTDPKQFRNNPLRHTDRPQSPIPLDSIVPDIIAKTIVLKEAERIIKKAKILSPGNGFPDSLDRLYVKEHSTFDSETGNLAFYKRNNQLYMETAIPLDVKDDGIEGAEAAINCYKIYPNDAEKLTKMIKEHPSVSCMKDFEDLNIDKPGQSEFLKTISILTDRNLIPWEEREDENGLYYRTNYRGYTIDLIQHVMLDRETNSNNIEQFFVRIAKADARKNTKTNNASIVFDSLNEKAAANLYELCQSRSKPMLSKDEKATLRKDLEQMGFLNKNRPQDLIKILENLGFVRQAAK